MMKRVTLIRHAKALPIGPDQDDEARPLSEAGRMAAAQIGRRLNKLAPDLVLCSPSIRTRETWDLASEALKDPVKVLFENKLYLASEDELLGRLEMLPGDVGSVWLIGHNPGLHDIVRTISQQIGARAMAQPVYGRFPPAAYASFQFSTSVWREIGEAPSQMDLSAP